MPLSSAQAREKQAVVNELMQREDVSPEVEKMLIEHELERRKAIEAEKRNKIEGDEAAKLGLHEGASFGTRPTLEALASGVQGGIGAYESGKGLIESVKAGGEFFKEERKEEIAKSKRAAEQHPYKYYGSQVVGGLATVPAVAAKGLMGAIKVGAAVGAGRAVGHAESKGAAAGEIAASTAVGAATYGLGKAVEKPLVAAAKKIFGHKILSKLAATTSGIDDRFIRDYASRVKKIDAQIRKAGGDWHEVTNVVKEKLNLSIGNLRKNMNSKITKVLEGVSDEKIFDAHRIIGKLNEVRDSLDDVTEKAAKKQIQEMIDAVFERSGKMSPTGDQVPLSFIDDKLSIGELFEIKKYLYRMAKGSYPKDGQIFIMPNAVKRAAKAAAFEARISLDKLSPQLKKANKVLERLHRVEEGINKSLIKVNAAEGSFIAGGAGLNKRSEKALKILSKMTGYDALGEAKTIATARAFDTQGIDFRPVGKTGLTLTRMIIGGGIGGAAGSSGGPAAAAIGMTVGAALSSPIGVKSMIKGGYLAGDVVRRSYRTLLKPQIANVFRRAYGNEKYEETLEALKPQVKKLKGDNRTGSMGISGTKDIYKTLPKRDEKKPKSSKKAEEFLKKGGKIFLENGKEIKEKRPIFKKKDGKLYYVDPAGKELKVKSVKKVETLGNKIKGTIVEGIIKPSKQLFKQLHDLNQKEQGVSRTPQSGEFTIKSDYQGKIKAAWQRIDGKLKRIDVKKIPKKLLMGQPDFKKFEVKKGRLYYHDRNQGVVLYLGKLKDLFKIKKPLRKHPIEKHPKEIKELRKTKRIKEI